MEEDGPTAYMPSVRRGVGYSRRVGGNNKGIGKGKVGGWEEEGRRYERTKREMGDRARKKMFTP